MRPWSGPRLRDASVREPSAHDAGPRACRRASPPPKRLARGGRGPPSPGGSAPPVRGPSRGAVAPRSIEHRRRRPLARARPRHGTSLEPDGVAGRKQATARRPTQPAAVAHRRGAPTRRTLVISACNQASSTALKLQHDISDRGRSWPWRPTPRALHQPKHRQMLERWRSAAPLPPPSPRRAQRWTAPSAGCRLHR